MGSSIPESTIQFPISSLENPLISSSESQLLSIGSESPILCTIDYIMSPFLR